MLHKMTSRIINHLLLHSLMVISNSFLLTQPVWVHINDRDKTLGNRNQLEMSRRLNNWNLNYWTVFYIIKMWIAHGKKIFFELT